LDTRLTAISLLLGLGIFSPAIAAPADCQRQPIKIIAPADLQAIIESHQLWLASRDGPKPRGVQANLSWTNLQNAKLIGVDLSNAILTGADLTAAEIDAKTRFDGDEDPTDADLRCAKLLRLVGLSPDANFPSVNFFMSKLADADLTGAALIGARMSGADLSGADFSGADVSKADFGRAILVDAKFSGTTVAGADFTLARLDNAIWQPKGAAPDATTMAGAKGLASLRLDPGNGDSAGLRELLRALRAAGLDGRGDEVAYALAVSETEQTFASGGWLLGGFRTVFYGWAAGYGLERLRPWFIFAGANLMFLPLYLWLGPRPDRTRLVRLVGAETHNFSRRGWAWVGYVLLFWLRSMVSAGIDKINLPELLGQLLPAVNSVQAKGRLTNVAAIQSVLSALLLLYACWFTFFHPLG
jgi:uncharacterized protein YjbI with pentapeptide repeats